MPKISTIVPHTLGQEQAQQRLRAFLPRVREHYGSQVSNLQESWDDNQLNFRFTTFGIDIRGHLLVHEADVQFNGDLPFAAMMFKGKIESSIRDELGKLLA